MSLKDSLRKAAEYFVDLPEGEAAEKDVDVSERPEGATHTDAAVAHPATDSDSMDDIDRRLAEMTRRMSGLNTEARATAADSSADETRPAETVTAPPTPQPDAAPPADDLRTANGDLDVAGLYAGAGVPSVPFSAEQTLDMIRSLPANMPQDVKRQTVRVAVASMGKAIGATPEAIVADAQRKCAALQAYAEGVAKQTGDFSAAADFEIAELGRQIEEKRAAVRDARARQEQIKERCGAEIARLSELTAFLGDAG